MAWVHVYTDFFNEYVPQYYIIPSWLSPQMQNPRYRETKDRVGRLRVVGGFLTKLGLAPLTSCYPWFNSNVGWCCLLHFSCSFFFFFQLGKPAIGNGSIQVVVNKMLDKAIYCFKKLEAFGRKHAPPCMLESRTSKICLAFHGICNVLTPTFLILLDMSMKVFTHLCQDCQSSVTDNKIHPKKTLTFRLSYLFPN